MHGSRRERRSRSGTDAEPGSVASPIPLRRDGPQRLPRRPRLVPPAFPPPPPSPPLDAGPVIARSGDAMQSLKSVHLTLAGNLVLNGLAGVKITGSGDLIYPHKENLSLQMEVPSSSGYVIVAINERIENGHEYIQIPSQGPAWKDVTGNSKGQIAPGMDPIANLEFAHAFRTSDDLVRLTMDTRDV